MLEAQADKKAQELMRLIEAGERDAAITLVNQLTRYAGPSELRERIERARERRAMFPRRFRDEDDDLVDVM